MSSLVGFAVIHFHCVEASALVDVRAITGGYPINPSSQFLDLDTDDATYAVLPSTLLGSGYFFTDITFGPAGALYASNVANAIGEGLAEIDPTTSSIKSFLPYTGPRINYNSGHAIAFNSTDVLFLMDQNRLSTVDLNTGFASFLAEYAKHFRSISFSPDGVLYGLASTSSTDIPDELWEISLDDYSLKFKGLTHGSVDTMRFAPDGLLYGITNNPSPSGRMLVTIDPSDGSYHTIGTLDGMENDVSGLAIRAVPEPTTLTLLGLGIAGISIAHKKKQCRTTKAL